MKLTEYGLSNAAIVVVKVAFRVLFHLRNASNHFHEYKFDQNDLSRTSQSSMSLWKLVKV